jgi:Ser/Thr protein kinase RdoA (MazF antagonist)
VSDSADRPAAGCDFDPALAHFALAMGLARPGEAAQLTRLAGGVSSDIWRLDLPGRALCIKRALPRLRVEADWQAPISRNAYEWSWLQFAAAHCPDNVPRPVAHDPGAGLFAMAFLAPDRYPVWKQQLLAGHVDESTAAALGLVLGRLHAASAGRAYLAARFDSGANFDALRLDPYLAAAAVRHPAAAPALARLIERTRAARIALVHGDVSPKNVLVGPDGPVLLDAECAWYGDPAFDIAFCVNHLLLKQLVVRRRSAELVASAAAFVAAHARQVDWEPAAELERRAASLLPALLLARVDGKSPVEYLTSEPQRRAVRTVALALLAQPVATLAAVSAACHDRFAQVGDDPC